jgi:hypothetical protein
MTPPTDSKEDSDMTDIGYPVPLEDMTVEQLEAVLENESDVLDGADIYGVIATVADYLDIDLVAALTVESPTYDESTIPTEMLDRIRNGSRGEFGLIGDLIDNSQSNPSSAFPALLKMALADNELGER